MATDAHVRLVHPSNNGGAKMLRRGYNFVDGSDGLGRMDAGLFFLAYVRDPRTQFIPIQMKLGRRAERVSATHRLGPLRDTAGHRSGRVRRPGDVRLRIARARLRDLDFGTTVGMGRLGSILHPVRIPRMPSSHPGRQVVPCPLDVARHLLTTSRPHRLAFQGVAQLSSKPSMPSRHAKAAATI